MLPEVLGYCGEFDLGTVLPWSPVCCESEFWASDRWAQALSEATAMQIAADTSHPM